MNSIRGGLGAYARLIWLDGLCIAALAMATWAMQYAVVFRQLERTIPLWPVMGQNDGFVDGSMLRGPVEYSHPVTKEVISTRYISFIILLVPIGILLIFQIVLRSWWDLHVGIFGVLKAILLSSLIQSILKLFMGGLRPTALALCSPKITNWTVLKPINNVYWVPLRFCDTDSETVDYITTSFPSRHSASAFAAALFLALYVNGKFKTFADFAPDFWVVIVTLAPLLGASVISAGLLVDHQHHLRDILTGIFIGVFSGLVAYRVSYASLLDFRYNHIPLPPYATHIRYSYDDTRKAESQGVMDPNIELTNKLVVLQWWGGAGEDAQRKDGKWLRSLRSLKKTDIEMNPLRVPKTPIFRARPAEPVDTEPQSPSGGLRTGSVLDGEYQGPHSTLARLPRVEEETANE